MAESHTRAQNRRISGDAYWTLHTAQKRIDAAKRELHRWHKDQIQQLGLHLDQVDWRSGAVCDLESSIERDETTGETRIVKGTVISHLPSDVVQEHQKRVDRIEDLVVKASNFRDRLAKRLGVWSDAINLKDGTIDESKYVPVEDSQQLSSEADQGKAEKHTQKDVGGTT